MQLTCENDRPGRLDGQITTNQKKNLSFCVMSTSNSLQKNDFVGRLDIRLCICKREGGRGEEMFGSVALLFCFLIVSFLSLDFSFFFHFVFVFISFLLY